MNGEIEELKRIHVYLRGITLTAFSFLLAENQSPSFFCSFPSGLLVREMSAPKMKDIDNETQLKIFGYSRETETELLIRIPTMIQYLVMLYYWINEKFTDHGSFMMNYEWNTVHGNNVINTKDESIKKYSWTFRINTITSLKAGFVLALNQHQSIMIQSIMILLWIPSHYQTLMFWTIL